MNAETGSQEVATEVEEKPAAAIETDKAVDATQETAEQKTERERDDKGKFAKPVQPRIDELTRKHREQERETAYWRQRAEAREAQEAAAEKAKAAEKPTPDKFTDYSEYVEALTDWKAEQRIKAEFDTRDKQSAAEKQAESRQKTWAERSAETVKELKDYEQVIEAGADTPIADHVAEILNDSPYGPKLLYHFAQNPSVAERINQLGPTAAAREIGRIEAGFEAAKAAAVSAESAPEEVETPQPAARKTQAPPPSKPVGSGRSATVNLEKVGMDEYKAARKAQGARWSR